MFRMKIYKVIAQSCDCEGKHFTPCVLEIFSTLELATQYKNDWENLWKKHTDNHECISPCWFDFKETLKIEECEVKTKYNLI